MEQSSLWASGIGVFLAAFGIILNERLIRAFFSSDGVLTSSTLWRIRLLNAGLVLTGGLFLIQARLAARLPGYVPCNYAVGGYSPQQMLAKIPSLHYFYIDLPPIRETHIRLTAQIIRESFREFHAHYPGNNRFVAVFYPGCRVGTRLMRYLKAWGVPYLDYSSLFDPRDPTFYLPGDGHPSPQAAEALARRLAQDLPAIFQGGRPC